MPDVADQVAAVQKFLASKSTITGAVGATGAEPWIFQRVYGAVVKNTGLRCLIIAEAPGWNTPNQHNTAEFPGIMVDAIADPTREAVRRNLTGSDAAARAGTLARLVRNILHRPYGGEWAIGASLVTIGGLRVIGSHATAEPQPPMPEPDGDGMMRVRTYYGLLVG